MSTKSEILEQPTKFNDLASGAVGNDVAPIPSEEINRLVEAHSLSGSDTAEFVNDRPKLKENTPETGIRAPR